MSTHQTADLLPVAASICQAEGLQLRHFLGGGSYKQAFLAENDTGGQLAVKVIQDPVPSKRTVREVESLRRCNHQSIASFIKLGSHTYASHQFQYLIEEYLPGGSLSAKLASEGSLHDHGIRELARPLILALAHLCDLALVHRDIKPDNILFREDGITPVLIDFGCVRDLSASSLTQTWLQHGPGTPYFASPEQLNNQKGLIDWRSDQFSLGVTLYFARFGSHPYQHPPEPLYAEGTVQRVAQRGDRNSSFYQNLGTGALMPVARMTAPWPVERYRTPADLLAAWSTN